VDQNPNSKLPKLLPSNPSNLSDEDKEWSKIIATLDTTKAPTFVVKLLRVYFKGGESIVFPVRDWLKNGEDINYVEETINRWFKINKGTFEGVEIVVDLAKLRETIQPITDETLKELN
jgi:hypothetical protein